MAVNELSNKERNVIIYKGTEAPFKGEFVNSFESGLYLCRQCDAPLYRSEDKFESGCGWPAFDDEIPGAITHSLDADGQRTEISCAQCGGHLGHIFIGEKLTPKNRRHCVNSISMTFKAGGFENAAFPSISLGSSESNAPESKEETEPLTPIPVSQKAYFAGGCFWGVEYYLEMIPGVLEVRSGYTGGKTFSPTYEEVCSGKSGHIEAVEVVYNPAEVSFEFVAKRFFEIHDPTQLNHQGPDYGEQYQSAIFYQNNEEKVMSENLINRLKELEYSVVTRLIPFSRFWPAEKKHQNYYSRKGSLPYCHAPVKRFAP